MINGSLIFKLHDSFGLPFDFIVQTLADRSQQFSVKDWILSAIKSKWSYDRISSTLLYALPEQDRDSLKMNIVLTYILAEKEANDLD